MRVCEVEAHAGLVPRGCCGNRVPRCPTAGAACLQARAGIRMRRAPRRGGSPVPMNRDTRRISLPLRSGSVPTGRSIEIHPQAEFPLHPPLSRLLAVPLAEQNEDASALEPRGSPAGRPFPPEQAEKRVVDSVRCLQSPRARCCPGRQASPGALPPASRTSLGEAEPEREEDQQDRKKNGGKSKRMGIRKRREGRRVLAGAGRPGESSARWSPSRAQQHQVPSGSPAGSHEARTEAIGLLRRHRNHSQDRVKILGPDVIPREAPGLGAAPSPVNRPVPPGETRPPSSRKARSCMNRCASISVRRSSATCSRRASIRRSKASRYPRTS